MPFEQRMRARSTEGPGGVLLREDPGNHSGEGACKRQNRQGTDQIVQGLDVGDLSGWVVR